MACVRLFAAILPIIVVSLAACAGASDAPQEDDPIENDEDELTAKKCGGIAGLKCQKGYECVIRATHPDAMGTCKKKAKPSCATMTCPAGQHCMVMGSPAQPMCM